MRFLVYAVAVLVAAGLVYLLASEPQQGPVATQVTGAEVQQTSAPEDAQDEARVPADAKRLVLHVPEMHCPFGCYPTVKESLTKQPGVFGVELAEQKVEGQLDNPRVLVTVNEKFNAEAALGALAESGFDGSNVE